MSARKDPSEMDAEELLELEQAHADRLADVLTFVVGWAADAALLHVIAVSGTQITVGDVVEGSLARYAAHRKAAPRS